MIRLPNLTIDRDGTDPDAEVMLTQDFGGNEHMVSLHPCQVRLLFERMGMLAASSNPESDRTIARLSRQMRLLLDRINTLDDWLNQAQQRGHEDLAEETAFSFSTWEMANEFCKELPGNAGVTPAAPLPASVATAANVSPDRNPITPLSPVGKSEEQALPLFAEGTTE